MNLTLRQGWVGLRLLMVMTALLGIVYPLAMFGVGRVVSGTSDGSYVTDPSGAVVGSALIGQQLHIGSLVMLVIGAGLGIAGMIDRKSVV